ncbi:hypothetical protein N9D31_01320 [Oligoflexaceae bacterium]|nr:hypothetical protein [Oligoflexaceae bacterium]
MSRLTCKFKFIVLSLPLFIYSAEGKAELCDSTFKDTIKAQYLSSQNPVIQFPDRSGKNLAPVNKAFDAYMKKMSEHVHSLDNEASLEMLSSQEILRRTGVTVQVRGPIEITPSELASYREQLSSGDRVSSYKDFYLEEIYSMANQPHYDGRKQTIDIPGAIMIQISGKNVPIRKALEAKQISREMHDFIVEMELMTRTEELYHAADHARHSHSRRSFSESFNKFIDWLGVKYDYSTMTEDSFAFYVRYELQSPLFKEFPSLRKEFLSTYPTRKILLDQNMDQIMTEAGWQ